MKWRALSWTFQTRIIMMKIIKAITRHYQSQTEAFSKSDGGHTTCGSYNKIEENWQWKSEMGFVTEEMFTFGFTTWQYLKILYNAEIWNSESSLSTELHYQFGMNSVQLQQWEMNLQTRLVYHPKDCKN